LTSFFRKLQLKREDIQQLMLIIPLLFVASVQGQSDAGYLKTIEGEASGLTVDQETARQQSTKAEQNPTRLFKNEFEDNLGGARIDLTPGLSIEQFERVLKNNYIGSYLFYKRLSDKKKAQVFRFYQSTPDPSEVRKKILQVSKQ